jgi:hypothetical protein
MCGAGFDVACGDVAAMCGAGFDVACGDVWCGVRCSFSEGGVRIVLYDDFLCHNSIRTDVEHSSLQVSCNAGQ